MPTEVFSLIATDVEDGDTSTHRVRPNAGPIVHTATLGYGNDFVLKVGEFQFVSFFRFELDIPKGDTITGVRLNLTSITTDVGNAFELHGGFLNPDNSRAQWVDADGFETPNYASMGDLPLAEWNDLGIDPTVWWTEDSTDHFVELAYQPIYTTDQDVSIGDGDLTGYLQLSGELVDQLQSILDNDDYDTDFRDTGVGDGLPVAFQLLQPGDTHNQEESQVIHSGGSTTAAFRPTLEVKWVSSDIPPVVTIIQPAAPISVGMGTLIEFEATSIDDEDGNISAGIEWSSDQDGSLHTGASFSTDLLSVNVHVITASSTDSFANTVEETIGVTVTNSPPVVLISKPATAITVSFGTPIDFRATSIDPDPIDGDITAGIEWFDSLDGLLHVGGAFGTAALIVGVHTITATSEDSGGLSDSDFVVVTVERGDLGVSARSSVSLSVESKSSLLAGVSTRLGLTESVRGQDDFMVSVSLRDTAMKSVSSKANILPATSVRGSLDLSVSGKGYFSVAVTSKTRLDESVSAKAEVNSYILSKRTTLEPAVSGKERLN